MFSEITGVDVELIRRLGTILSAVNTSDQVIDPGKFDLYALETAQLFVSLYPWFYLPASVHKLLVHGSECIRSLPLPIGMLSDEAREREREREEQRHKVCTRAPCQKNLPKSDNPKPVASLDVVQRS